MYQKKPSFFYSETNIGSWDIWFGPLGFHLYWPDFWNSRPDWYSDWKNPPRY